LLDTQKKRYAFYEPSVTSQTYSTSLVKHYLHVQDTPITYINVAVDINSISKAIKPCSISLFISTTYRFAILFFAYLL
ncbi:hypothetical protein, partial [Flavobacterium sp.]|uniref:hypothetical protein n=1 Tax=Flavobacterium sp. TaxID=239 RepID=UPI0037C165BE